MKEKESRAKLLDMQLEAAAVEPAEGGYFNVFVPGAVREHNSVIADDEAAAKKKVREFLLTKQDQLKNDVAIQADNLKINSGVDNG